MENYPGNSKRVTGKEPTPEKEPKVVEKVTSGAVVRRKKPLGKRFSETFLGGNMKSVATFVAWDVLIPAAKDAFSDAVSQGVERMLFGESRPGRSRGGNRYGGSSTGYTQYNKFGPASGGRPEDPRQISRRGRSTHNFDEIVLATRADAEEVIDRLFDLVSRYDQANVGDLYELVGISGNFTDQKWGWTDLRGASVTRTRGGYLLDLPRPEPLD